MRTNSPFKLVVLDTGRELTSFDRYTVEQSMFTFGNAFTFSLWADESNESSWRAMMLEIKLGHRILATLHDVPVLVGTIETIDVAVTREGGAALVISGRDLAGLAADWDINPKTNVRDLTLDEALFRVFNQVGLEVVTGTAADATILTENVLRRGAPRRSTRGWNRRRNVVKAGRPEKGETILSFANKLITRLGFMAWTVPDADGNLAVVVDKPSYDSAPVFKFERRFEDVSTRRVLTATSNILESKYSAQIRNIPTTVSAYGRSQRGDQLSTRVRTRIQTRELLELGEATDFRLYTDLRASTVPGVIREVNRRNAERARQEQSAGFHRRTITSDRVVATRINYTNDDLARWACVVSPMPPHPRHLHDKRAVDPRTGEQTARRVMAKAMKDFRRYEVVVRGHTQVVDGAERLYSINTMARVYDGRTYLDENMLITDIRFEGSRKTGTTTTITLGTQGAIDLTPETT